VVLVAVALLVVHHSSQMEMLMQLLEAMEEIVLEMVVAVQAKMECKAFKVAVLETLQAQAIQRTVLEAAAEAAGRLLPRVM
jgi:hypothetical protein